MNHMISFSDKWAGQLLKINFPQNQCAILKFVGKASRKLYLEINSSPAYKILTST